MAGASAGSSGGKMKRMMKKNRMKKRKHKNGISTKKGVQGVKKSVGGGSI